MNWVNHIQRFGESEIAMKWHQYTAEGWEEEEDRIKMRRLILNMINP